MNFPKEDAKIKYVEMVKNSWTYNRMTDKEQTACIRALYDARGVIGTAAQRWEILHSIYSAFLAALDYCATGWRETKEANNPKF